MKILIQLTVDMLKHIFNFLFLFCLTESYSQVLIDFENNILTDWEQSDSDHWEISSMNNIAGIFSLHHAFDNASSGSDQIALPLGQLELTQPVTWKFKIKHGYPPSSSNNWSVFLFSDGGAKQMSPSNSCHALVLGVNFTGSNDTLKIWEKSKTGNIELASSNFNWQESVSNNDYVVFEIRFSPPENWAINLSVNGDSDKTLLFEFSASPPIEIANYFGIYYEYSSSQDQKLWFDDLEIDGNFPVDATPPSILSATVQQDIIDLTFSEAINIKSINENSISLSPKISFTIVSESSNQLILHLDESFEVDQEYSLNLKNIADLSGNDIKDTTLTVQYSVARQNDIIITEIMTDPLPPVGLPEQEFIEIYNRSTKLFNLTNYSIWVGDKQQIIRSGNIMPDEYLIICDDNDTEEFSEFGKIAEVTSLPNITKSSGKITLRNNLGRLVHQLQYTDNVFLSEIKQSGGWTLEIIDPDNPCHFENNWSESDDVSGGTPGKQNSIFARNKDFEPPAIKNISVSGETSIQICFNEQVDSLYTAQNLSFGLEKIKTFEFFDLKTINALTSEPIAIQKLYETRVMGVKDCSANIIDNTVYYKFAITEEPDSLDIVFNEIMFDTILNFPEYIEIINASDKFLDLSYLELLKRKSTLEFDTFLTTTTSTLFLPEQLGVLSKSNALISNNYAINQDAIYLEMEKFPKLTNTSGVLAIQDSTGSIIDVFEYSESMHFDLLQETKNVSLEKINIENPSLDKNNWQSASASENYATPGWPNSQMFNYNSASYTPFTIEPEVFSPNFDGYNDELLIKYHFNETGMVINIKIFDAKGRLINQLANNFLCGSQGEFIWRGEKFDDAYALNGIYMIYIEYFDLKGNVNRKKETCVLAR